MQWTQEPTPLYANYHQNKLGKNIMIRTYQSSNHFLCYEMAKMAKCDKIQVQISGWWLKLSAPYLQVKIPSHKTLIDEGVSRGCQIWLTLPIIRFSLFFRKIGNLLNFIYEI